MEIKIKICVVFFRDPPGAQTVTFVEVESTLRKRRQTTVPPVPATLEELAAAFEDLDTMHKFGTGQASDGSREPFFRGLLVGEGDDRTAVFATASMCPLLRNAKVLHIDGTFKTVPRAAGMRQLVTVHAAVGEHVSITVQNCILALYLIETE